MGPLHYFLFPPRHVRSSYVERRLEGETILITGASSGIGEALALRLAGLRARLLLLARQKEKLQTLAEQLQEQGTEVEILLCDLSKSEDVQQVVHHIVTRGWKLSAIVCNAGRSQHRYLYDTLQHPYDAQRLMGVNYSGHVQLLMGLLPQLAPGAQILSVSSAAVLAPAAVGWGAYSASKLAIDSWLQAAEPELAAHDVSVSYLYFPLVDTPMLRKGSQWKGAPALTAREAAERILSCMVSYRRRFLPWWMRLYRPFHPLVKPFWRHREKRKMRHRYGLKRPYRMRQELKRLQLLSLGSLSHLTGSLLREGMNLAALSRFALWRYGEQEVIVDDEEHISYRELYERVRAYAAYLYREQSVDPGLKVAISCRNSAKHVAAIFALHRLGAHLYFVATDWPRSQLEEMARKERIALLLTDMEHLDGTGTLMLDALHAHAQRYLPQALSPRERQEETLGEMDREGLLADEEELLEDIAKKPLPPARTKIKRLKGGNIVVLTSGSTGTPKTASRKPQIGSFLSPLRALLEQVGLAHFSSVFIAPPIYHGYGFASLVVTMLLGKKMLLSRRFDAPKAAEAMRLLQIETFVAVPTIISRLLEQTSIALPDLKCILSGGAPLLTDLARRTEERFGPVLYNLYGTSEAGFMVLATPEDLSRFPGTIGRPIRGAKAEIDNPNSQGIGPLSVCTDWAVSNRKKQWQPTGDIAFRNYAGYLYIMGRNDEGILSGGELVFPQPIEEAAGALPFVEEVAVVAYQDEEFGARFICFVSARPPFDAGMVEAMREELQQHLRAELPRYQQPAQCFIVREMPHNAAGKPNKKVLLEQLRRREASTTE